jgi:hypothetical protein
MISCVLPIRSESEIQSSIPDQSNGSAHDQTIEAFFDEVFCDGKVRVIRGVTQYLCKPFSLNPRNSSLH